MSTRQQRKSKGKYCKWSEDAMKQEISSVEENMTGLS